MYIINQYIEGKLNERQQHGNYRTLKTDTGLIDFCSNDYLGFARSPLLKELIETEVRQHHNATNGSTGSRLLAGNTEYTVALEQQLASLHQCEAGLIFNSGYDANVGLFSSLPQRGDTVLHDELIHASIIDGIRLSHANRHTFKHNDLQQLEDKLKRCTGRCYVVIESIYSMDGDKAPLSAIATLCEQYGAALIVDEAHATGLFGYGLVQQLQLQNQIFARVVTFGKALGTHGAIVLGSDSLINYLINFARSFIYTTAAPFHQLAAIKMAYQLLSQSQPEVLQLQKIIQAFRQHINNTDTGLRLIDSDSAIQCLVTGSAQSARQAAQQLQQAGLDVRAILLPTVAAGTERLRICLHSFNTADELHILINTLLNIKHEQY